MIEYDKFQMSLKRLEEQYENYRDPNASLSELIQEAIAESVIQRFETCYDCLWEGLETLPDRRIGPRRRAQQSQTHLEIGATRTICSPCRWSNGCVTPTDASVRLTITTARRRAPA